MTELVKCMMCEEIVERSKAISMPNNGPFTSCFTANNNDQFLTLINLYICESHLMSSCTTSNGDDALLSSLSSSHIRNVWDLKTSESVRSCDEKELILCLMKSKIVNRPNCPKCHQLMKPKFRQVRGNSWICRRKGKDCSSSSMKHSTIFSNSHIKLVDQIAIAVSWLNGKKLSEMTDCSVSRRTIIDQIHQYRLECIRYWKNTKLGGPGVGIELKVHDLTEIGYCNQSGEQDRHPLALVVLERKKNGKVFVEFLTKITSEAVHDVLLLHVLPGSYIVCDDWRNFLVGNKNFDLFSNSKNVEIEEAIQVLESVTNNGVMQTEKTKDKELHDHSTISKILGIKNDTTVPLEMSYSEESRDEIENTDDFFDYLIASLDNVWQRMSSQEKDEVVAERIMRFNGRENPHKFFWKMLVEHYSKPQ